MTDEVPEVAEVDPGVPVAPVVERFAIVPASLLDDVSHGAVALYALLAAVYANRDTGDCYPTYKRLATDLRVTDRAVYKWMTELVDAGAVEREAGRPGRATVLRLVAVQGRRSTTVRGRKAVDKRAGSGPALNTGSVPTEHRFSAALNTGSHQPEESSNQRRARAPRDGSPAGDQAPAPRPTHLGRGLDAAPLWDLDDNGNAVPRSS